VWHLGLVPVRAQALFAVAGILVAMVIAQRRYQAAGGRPGVIADIAAWVIPAGLVPAAIGAVIAPLRGGAWQAIRTLDDAFGFAGAAVLGTLAAWVACRRIEDAQSAGACTGTQRTLFIQFAGAVAPALAFGHAIATLGDWVAQDGYGHPSSLWWAVEISPAHRLAGYENFATFQPVFIYQALWDVTTGIVVIYLTRRFALPGDRTFALQASAYAVSGFALFWLGIEHLPVALGLKGGELGDAIVLVGAATYLARTWRKRTTSYQNAQKSPLERDSPVM
jgi:prolipoprotein diacylglyceryltransferase